LGRLQQSLVTGLADPLPNIVRWEWVETAQGWEPLDTVEEFDIAFDYREQDFTVRGLRFCAEVSLAPVITTHIRVLHSAGVFTEFILENIMRILVAYRAADQGGLLLHSACFTDGQKTWLLFGHSGAGKSTCSDFASQAGMQVLSDDMNVIFPAADGWKVRRVPFSGTSKGEYSGPPEVALTNICHLRQSDTNRLQALSAATGVSLLLASAAFANEDPWRTGRLLKNCKDLLQYVAVQALYFRRDADFLSLLVNNDDPKAVT